MRNTKNMIFCRRVKQCSVTVLTVLCINGQLAHSKADDNKKGRAIEEVIVTSQKREERLLDVPMSVSVVDAEALKNMGIQNIHDLSYAVSSLSVADYFPAQSISIRGISNSLGTSALVGAYLDELPTTNVPSLGNLISLQSIDLKRIEVLKGPQGTLYGQGSVGGAVRFITNPPSFNEFDTNFSLSTYNTKGGKWSEELTGVVNIPIIDNTLALRIAGTYKDKSGWIDQPTADIDNANDSELSHIRISGLWSLTEKFSIKAMTVRNRLSGSSPNFSNVLPSTDNVYQVPNINDARFSSTDIENDYELHNLTLDYDLGFATIVSSSSQLNVDSDLALLSSFFNLTFIPTAPLNQVILDTFDKANAFSQEIRLTGDTNTLKWTIGVFYNNSEYIGGSSNVINLLNDSILYESGSIASTKHSTSMSVFGDLSYTINDRLELSIGTRYFEDDQRFESPGINSVDTEFDDLSSKISLSYALADNSNLFVSWSEGFRSGGLNIPAIGETTPVPYDPESVVSYELGVKTSLIDRQLNIEGAIFYSQYSDYQSFEAQPLTGLNKISNASEAEIKGVEWAVQWAASEYLSLGFNGDFTEAEFTDVNDLVPTYKEGDKLNFIPKYSYSVYTDLAYNLSPLVSSSIHFDYSRHGPRSATFRGAGFVDETVESVSFGVLNAHFGLKWGALDMKFFARNLNNEKRPSTVSSTRIFTRIQPRTVGIEFAYDF